MTKKQREAVLRVIRKDWGHTNFPDAPPEPDLPVPERDETTHGYRPDTYSMLAGSRRRAVRAMTSQSYSHCEGHVSADSHRRSIHGIRTQGGIPLYSTPERAFARLEWDVLFEAASGLLEVRAGLDQLPKVVQ